MAQEQDRDIHLPQPSAAPRAQHPKTAPRAVPLDEAAFRIMIDKVNAPASSENPHPHAVTKNSMPNNP